MEPLKPIIVRESAREDIRLAGDWLEAQRPGAGDDLVSEIVSATLPLASTPEMYRIEFPPDVRRAVLDRFGYLIFYRVRPTRVVIIAVIHARRRPTELRRRIRRELREPDEDR